MPQSDLKDEGGGREKGRKRDTARQTHDRERERGVCKCNDGVKDGVFPHFPL